MAVAVEGVVELPEHWHCLDASTEIETLVGDVDTPVHSFHL